jgi:hypothetical protein
MVVLVFRSNPREINKREIDAVVEELRTIPPSSREAPPRPVFWRSGGSVCVSALTGKTWRVSASRTIRRAQAKRKCFATRALRHGKSKARLR